MVRIHASCPDCGRVTLGVGDLTVWLAETGDWVEFDCPTCPRARVRQPVAEVMCRRLVDVGVTARLVGVPAEALERRTGAPLSWDDVIDFSLLLGGTDFLALAAEVESRGRR